MALRHSPSLGPVRPGSTTTPARIILIRDFQLLIGEANVAVPPGVQRLVAFLAMAARPVSRTRLAGQLWLDVPEWRALGNLRSALWRLRRIRRPIVKSLDDRLALDNEVEVDVFDLSRLMTRLTTEPDDAALSRLPQVVAATETLPGWDDEWIVVERERFRELRLHALERACAALLGGGHHSAAVQAALAAIETEPFRDSAQRLLVLAYLEEGNRAAALRAYHAFRDLMEAELGLEPSDAMNQLVAGLLPGSHAAGRASQRPSALTAP
jgi:DNA-binding SARP family transcriptional activator